MSQSPKPVVLAAVAHPDDIEFLFSGTLLRLKEAGCKIHMWNLLDGSCGTMTHSREEIIRIRSEEAARSAVLAGATMHPAVFPDLGVFYDRLSLAVVSAVVRSIRPQIILTHSASDYMEDHENVCRLVTSAAFSRAMPNFSSKPECPPYKDPVRIYHAPPHGLRDGLGEMFRPDFLVDVAATMATTCWTQSSTPSGPVPRKASWSSVVLSSIVIGAVSTPLYALRAPGRRRNSAFSRRGRRFL